MYAGLDENETKLGVLVLSVSLKVLADGDRLSNLISVKPSTTSGEERTFLINM